MSGLPKKTRLYTNPLSVKVDWEMLKTLDLIAAFEHRKRSTLCRDILLEKTRVYERNPAYKRFLVTLEQQRQAEKTRG
jgi:hypothetical protein